MKAIDVSYWQGSDVNFNKVKASGIDVVIIRAGFGNSSSQYDKYFNTNYQKAKAAGLKIGAYWYSYASGVSDAQREAAACLEVIRGKSFDLPIYYDLEESSIASLGYGTCTNIATAFCDAIKQGGYRAGVYANANWFSNYLNYSALSAKYSIWLAQWSTYHTISCDIWQYSENGIISGISGNVDMNLVENTSIINGSSTATTATVQAWLNKLYNCGLEVDGIYGRKTKAEIVKGLQRVLNVKYKANLVVDGIFGVKTKAAVRPLKKGSKGGYPSILQAFLICLGYDTGGFDGDFGNKTETAVKTFQSKNKLDVTGIADSNTFEKLGG